MRTLFLCSIAALILVSFTTDMRTKLKLPGEFVKIPAGTFHLSDSTPRIRIMEFYMSKYEVTNLQYRNFFNEVSPNMSEEEKQKISCDTSAWKEVIKNGEAMRRFYYQQPPFDQYPVVNVSYEGAAQYCKWLREKLQKENPDFEFEVRLPSKEEWIWAGMGGRSQAMFPWGNYYLRNRKGEFLCNFRRVHDGEIHKNRATGKPEVWEFEYSQTQILTASVKSFQPNDYGLYNMCGNVAEMITTKGICIGGSWNDYGGDVNLRAQMPYENPSPTVGFRPVIIVKNKTNN